MAQLLNNPIFDLAPDFAGVPSLLVSTAGSLIGEGFAARLAQFAGKHPRHTLNHEWHLKSAAEIKQFCQFFDQQGGRWGGFFIPSYQAELSPVADILNGESALQIDPVDYAGTYFLSTNLMGTGFNVALIHRDGSRHYARIIAAEAGTPEILTLDTPVTRDWLAGEFFVSFLYYVRFVNDVLTLDFNGPNEATVRAPMIENVLVAPEVGEEGDPKSTDDMGESGGTAPSEGADGDTFTTSEGEEFVDAGGNTFTVN